MSRTNSRRGGGTGGRGGRSTSDNACYKCGKNGHWDCPDNGGGGGFSGSATSAQPPKRGRGRPRGSTSTRGKWGRPPKKKSTFGAADD
ncbi:hypothetical protein H0H92_001208 [Tricholoma furcatifolium]|nr:hypothetical protein H0H92_001208 [Tricholoma furcatifolium]